MAQTQLTVPVRPGYNFGVGADLLSGAPMNKSVNSDVISSVVGAGGSSVNFVVQRIQTTQDLEQALGISAEASYGSPSFGSGVSARFDFAKTAKIQSNSLFMTVTATIKLKVLSIDAPALTDEASRVVDRPDIFAQRFGNVFVRTIERGGIFIGVLRIDTSSSEESESIDAELKGSYGLFSADAKLRFSEIEKKFRSSVFVQMYHEGGPPDLAIRDPTNPLELLTNADLFLSSFATRPEDVAVPYLAILAPVTIATGPFPPNEVDLAHAQDVMRFCATRRSVLLDQLNLLQLFVDRPSRFDFSNGASLAEIRIAADNTQLDLDLIKSCASAAIDSPRGALFPADFAQAAQKVFPAAVLPKVLPVGKPRVPEPSDAIADVLRDIVANDREAAPFFSVPFGGGLEHPVEGPAGGRFVIFSSNLRAGPPGATSGPSAGIFFHPKLGTFYVYGLIYMQYETRYRFCFGHMGANMGYPKGNQFFNAEQGAHMQFFEGGQQCPELGDVDNAGNEVPNIAPQDRFVWQGHP